MEKPWFKNYPESAPRELDTSMYDSILDMFDKAIFEHRIVLPILIWGRC